MEQKNLSALNAIDIAMKAEQKAHRFYLDALASVFSEKGKNLLLQLANFEQAHCDALKELRASLVEQGNFIEYAGTRFSPFKASSEVTGDIEPNKDDVFEILIMAIDAETKAYEQYRKMADETADPKGQDMFQKLADEEIVHRRILNDEFYYLNNSGGIWFWGD